MRIAAEEVMPIKFSQFAYILLAMLWVSALLFIFVGGVSVGGIVFFAFMGSVGVLIGDIYMQKKLSEKK
jgi:hypothetical protein